MNPLESAALRASIMYFAKLVLAAAVASCSGCLSHANAKPSEPTITVEQVDAIIADWDQRTYTPSLPDSLKKQGGTAEAPASVESKIEVRIYGPPGCDPCSRAIKEGNTSQRFHFTKSEDLNPGIRKVADDWNQGGYPIAVFKDRNGLDRFVAPWRGLKDFEIRYNRTVPPRDPPKKAQAGELVFGQVASAWTWPGGIDSHLIQTHGLSPSKVASMSDAEKVATHDSLHGSYGAAPGKKKEEPSKPFTPFDFLEEHNVKSIAIECDRGSVEVGGKRLLVGPGIYADVTRSGEVFSIVFRKPAPALAVGFGIQVPFRIEVSKQGMDAVASTFGVTKRQRIVFQDQE